MQTIVSSNKPHVSLKLNSAIDNIMRKKLTFILLVLFIGGTLAIPEIYQSMTLWYKYGAERLLLKAGQSAGMFAFALLNIQLLLAVRGKWLTETFGMAKVIKYHKANGILISLFAVAHVLLVLLPEGLANLPFGMKFWPEMVGGVLLLLLITTVILSKYRTQLKLPYPLWRSSHKVVGYSLIILLNIHVLFVSDTFEQTVPRIFLVTTFLLLTLWLVLVKLTPKKQKG